MSPTTALLLIAHGSRHEEANDDTRFLAAELARRGPHAIAIAAFLELATPTIDEGAEQCVRRGANRVVLLPHFLSAGVHVQRDLSAARERLSRRHAGVEFLLAEPIGRDERLLEIFEARLRAAIAGEDSVKRLVVP